MRVCVCGASARCVWKSGCSWERVKETRLTGVFCDQGLTNLFSGPSTCIRYDMAALLKSSAVSTQAQQRGLRLASGCMHTSHALGGLSGAVQSGGARPGRPTLSVCRPDCHETKSLRTHCHLPTHVSPQFSTLVAALFSPSTHCFEKAGRRCARDTLYMLVKLNHRDRPFPSQSRANSSAASSAWPACSFPSPTLVITLCSPILHPPSLSARCDEARSRP